MTISTDIAAARAAIAAVPADFRHLITLEQTFIAAHTFAFVMFVLAAGVLLGVALSALIGFGWGAWAYIAWVLLLLLIATLIAAAFRPKLAITK
jgi:predicted lipid-binding transport protein (Tim44 family)